MFSTNSCQFILHSDLFKLAAIAEMYIFGLQQFTRSPILWVMNRYEAHSRVEMGKWYIKKLISKSWQNNTIRYFQLFLRMKNSFDIHIPPNKCWAFKYFQYACGRACSEFFLKVCIENSCSLKEIVAHKWLFPTGSRK